MNAPRIAIALLIAITATAPSFAQSETHSSSNIAPAYTLSLHYGKDVPLSKDAAQMLYSKAMDFLFSSNFNSSIPRWREQWGIAKIQDDYRRTIRGNYLLVTFKDPQKIKTVGGEITVLEIVVGLNGQQYADALFTIDDEGRIISHAKYSGPLGIEFLNLVKKVAAGNP